MLTNNCYNSYFCRNERKQTPFSEAHEGVAVVSLELVRKVLPLEQLGPQENETTISAKL